MQTPEERSKMIYELWQAAGSGPPLKMREIFGDILTKFLGAPVTPLQESESMWRVPVSCRAGNSPLRSNRNDWRVW